MSITISTVSNFTPYCRAPTLSWNPRPSFAILKLKHKQHYNYGLRWNGLSQRNFKVNASSVPPEAPVPSKPSSNSFINQILGVVMTIILPFLSNKMGPLWIFKNKIENTVDTVEQIANTVEKVAEEVDKMVDNITDDLPEGQLKNMLESLDDIAEKAAHGADFVGDFIDQVQEEVQEAQERVESFVDSLDDEAKEEESTNKTSK